MINIVINKDMLEHKFYPENRHGIEFSKFESWIYLLINIEREAGIFETNITKLSDDWGWSRTKVNNFLEELAEDNFLVFFKQRNNTLISRKSTEKNSEKSSEKDTKKDTKKDTLYSDELDSLQNWKDSKKDSKKNSEKDTKKDSQKCNEKDTGIESVVTLEKMDDNSSEQEISLDLAGIQQIIDM